jgi:predicted DNA-binding transcriptional regulator AlpA
MEPVLTTEQLAQRYGITPNAVAQRRQRRQGPRGFRSGRRVLYHESEVLAWEKAHRDEEMPAAS